MTTEQKHPLRPADLRGRMPEPRVEAAPAPPALDPDFIAAYDRMSASDARKACESSEVFSKLATELNQRRGINANV
jgi:hypothetical protein